MTRCKAMVGSSRNKKIILIEDVIDEFELRRMRSREVKGSGDLGMNKGKSGRRESKHQRTH